MALIFWLTFGFIGGRLSNLLNMGIGWITNIADNILTAYQINDFVHSLIIDGIFSGIGSVLSFVPIIITLFFFLSLLEDSGYMARVAFIMDKLLRKIGLSGRSIVPMLIGFGCTVPAVLSSRMLSSQRDRKMTVLLVSFMSCSAKLPIYALFSAAFFPKYSTIVMIGLYLLGIMLGILSAVFLKNTKFKGNPVPFVIELPNYRMPSIKNMRHLLWEKAKDFLKKAFTLIFVASIVIWLLQTLDIRLNIVNDPQKSILSNFAGLISPIFAPLGFGDWKITVSIITGIMAKESVISTISVLFGNAANLLTVFSQSSAAAFLVFSLLYTPCITALSAIKREQGIKTVAIVALAQFAIAWGAAWITKATLVLAGM
jgi:ferrous iron transport protein B